MPTPRSHARTLLVGVTIVVICVLLILSPIVLGKGVVSNAIVAFSTVGFCIGGSVLLHGTWDWWRGR